jgi:DNA-binding NarL/FixJ family response regulator
MKQILLDEGGVTDVAEANDANGVMNVLATGSWDVIVFEASLVGPVLQEQLANYRRMSPASSYVVLNSFPLDYATELLMDCGADAVVMEDRIAEDLVSTVQKFRRRETFFQSGHPGRQIAVDDTHGGMSSVSALSSTDLSSRKSLDPPIRPAHSFPPPA